MKIHRFIGDFDLTGSELLSTDVELANQIKNVLRLVPGEQVVLANGRGQEAIASLAAVDKKGCSFAIIEKRSSVSESENFVTLYCSILKHENFELAVQKAVECGAGKIVPVISARTVKTGFKMERLVRIVKEASEQCGRAVVPVINETLMVSEALAMGKENDRNWFFDPSGAVPAAGGGKIGVWIGPEGGWTALELAEAKEYGCEIIGLGRLILRGETAATVGTYLATHA